MSRIKKVPAEEAADRIAADLGRLEDLASTSSG